MDIDWINFTIATIALLATVVLTISLVRTGHALLVTTGVITLRPPGHDGRKAVPIEEFKIGTVWRMGDNEYVVIGATDTFTDKVVPLMIMEGTLHLIEIGGMPQCSLPIKVFSHAFDEMEFVFPVVKDKSSWWPEKIQFVRDDLPYGLQFRQRYVAAAEAMKRNHNITMPELS